MHLERNMARWAIAAAAVLVVAGIGAVPATKRDASSQTGSAIGFVNSDVILRQTPGYDTADSTLRANMQAYQGELEALRQQLDSAMTAYDQQQIVLSPTAREEKMGELRQIQERFNSRGQELQTRLAEREQELVAPLQQRIQTVIDGLRAERNMAVIFDVASPANGIVSADPALDLTQVVITRIRNAGTP
jgi:outer membrane protein